MLPFVTHPAFVHFPLAMLTTAWVCVLALHRTQGPAWDQRARLFEGIGIVFLPVTIIAGFVDANGIEVFTRPRADLPLLWHASVSLAAAAVFTGHWWWRRGRAATDVLTSARVDVWAATVGSWLLVVAGLLAGEMVHGL